MTLYIPNDGRQPPKLVKLTSTDATTLLAGDANSVLTIESIAYSCKGTTTNLSIWITDGTTSAYLMDTEAVTTRTHAIISNWNPTLPNALHLLRAQASNADQIDFIVTFAKKSQTR